MNLIAREIFNFKNGASAPNTFIGGVSATIGTAFTLSQRLSINISRITNFSVVGSDIQCRITGSYVFPDDIWQWDYVTYYRDIDGLVTSIGGSTFFRSNFVEDVYFKNCITVGGNAFSVNCRSILLPNATSLGNAAFYYGSPLLRTVYIPNVTTLGTGLDSQGSYQQVFLLTHLGSPMSLSQVIIYAHPSMATINAGGVEGDLAYAISRGATVRYVTNFNEPNPITNLSIGTVYATAIQLNFTAPSSTNAIEFYDCYANGVLKNTITASGGYITGLSPNTSYTIEVKPVDIFLNKGSSNVVTLTTIATYYTDTDANAYISAASLSSSEQESAYKLIVDLKTNNLWNKIQALYPFKGTTAAQHKWNAKNPLDTNAAFRLTFNGTGIYSNLGYQCDGANAFARTFLTPRTICNQNSNGFTLSIGTNNNVVGTANQSRDMGCYDGETSIMFISPKFNNANANKYYSSANYDTNYIDVNDAKGILTGTRQSSSIIKLFKNGVNKTNATTTSTILPNRNIFIGAHNVNEGGWGFSTQRIQIAIIHEGLSDAEVVKLHEIIDLSESIAGRKTW